MNLPEKTRRRRYSAEEKAAIMTRYASCGKTQAAFCREGGIAVPTFAAWRRRATPRAIARPGDLVEVKLPGLAASAEVRLEVNGCSVWVSVGTSPAWLGAVVQQLRAC